MPSAARTEWVALMGKRMKPERDGLTVDLPEDVHRQPRLHRLIFVPATPQRGSALPRVEQLTQRRWHSVNVLLCCPQLPVRAGLLLLMRRSHG